MCDFGVPPEQATRTIALVGDSHASHWRTSLDVVARERGWRGISITRTSCPFSSATKIIPEPTRSQCRTWVKSLPGYFRRHPEIDTLFVVAHHRRQGRRAVRQDEAAGGGATASAMPGTGCRRASSTSS